MKQRPSTKSGSTASTATGRRGRTRRVATTPTSAFGDYRFRVRARNISGQVERGSRLRLHDPAAVVSDVVGVSRLRCPASACSLSASIGVQRRRVVGQGAAARAQFAEASLRAEAAEALAATESEGKKNVELLSEMGREITASLDFDTIFGKLYDRVNELADADVFGVGLYHPTATRSSTSWRSKRASGTRRTRATRRDPNQLPVWCIEHREPVFINDSRPSTASTSALTTSRAVRSKTARCRSAPQSIIYLPLIAKERVLGIITIQSFKKNAYTEHHLNVMQSLASYTAIALDNAAAYRQLNEQEHEIRRLFEEAEKARADRGGSRRRQERVPLDGQPRAAHAADLGARLRQDHQEAAGGPHLPARARPTIARSRRPSSRSKTTSRSSSAKANGSPS